jgi:hypothetical protein
LHEFGLAGCSHAIISVGRAVWLIDLSLSQGKPENQWATLLDPMSSPHQIGIATISAWNANTAAHHQELISAAATSPASPAVSPAVPLSNDSLSAIDAAIDLDLLAHSYLKQPPSASFQQITGMVAKAPLPSTIVIADRAADAERLATHITNRLADTQQVRLKFRRQINAACLAFVLLVIVPTICWPIFRVVLPLFYGDT